MENYIKLHRRLQLFVDAHVETGTAAGAVRKLKYRTKNPYRRGHKLMRLQGVREAIEERRAEAIAEVGMTQVAWLRQLTAIARFDPRRLFNPDTNTILPPSEWPDDVAAAIAGLDIEGIFAGSGKDRYQIGDLHKYKAWNKIDALRTLGQYMKLLTEKHEHSGPNGAPIPVAATTVTPEQLREAVQSVRDKF